MNQKILVLHQTLKNADDILSGYLRHTIEIYIVHTLEAALLKLECIPYVLLVIEVVPPWMYGTEPLFILRTATDIPILALLRSHSIDDFKRCKEFADDCVWEPFMPEEIAARGTALMECSTPNFSGSSNYIYCRNLLIMPIYRRVYINEKEVALTRKEYSILLFMARHKEQVLSKEQIYTNVWHDDYIDNIDGIVSYHIHSLRKKISYYANEEYIENVWGEGYRFRAQHFEKNA